jgi:hypothetical protein
MDCRGSRTRTFVWYQKILIYRADDAPAAPSVVDFLPSRCLSWVNMRKTRREQMFSALPNKRQWSVTSMHHKSRLEPLGL